MKKMYPDTSNIHPFQRLFDLSLDIICILDNQGHFLRVNDAAFKTWGYNPVELIGLNVFDLIYVEDKYKTVAITKEAIDNDSNVVNFENRYVRKDGSLVHMEWSSIYDPSEGLAYCIGRDISDRKRKEKQIEEQKEKLEKAQEIAQLGYWEYDLIENTGYWSDSLYAIYGLDKASFGDITIEKYIAMVHPEDRTEMIKNMALFQTNNKLEHINRLIRPDGKIIFVNNIYSIKKDSKGTLLNLSGVSQDITEKIDLESHLTKEKEDQKRRITRAVIEAQEKERSKISRDLHDNVNQVLTTVKLYMELSLSNEFDTLELKQKSVKYLTDCINEIRTISRSLSAPTIGSISLKDSLQDLIKSVSDTNRIKINLKFSGFAKEDVHLETDLHLGIYRILQEQLTNILKHAQATKVKVEIHKRPGRIELKVQDDGIGYNLSEKREGIGITNMITRTEALNGTLQMESKPGEGFQLTCSFPLPETSD